MSMRPLALAGVLGAAVGGPYVISQAPDKWDGAWGPSPQPAQQQAASEAAYEPDPLKFEPPTITTPTGPGSKVYASPASLTGPPGMTLADLLNWNVTKNWVYSHWDRKSTGLSDPELFGVRAPIVTGNGMTDVAGAVSYYFDAAGALQRIRLRGRTADTSRLVYLAASAFGMQPQPSAAPGEQLFQARDGKRLTGELRTRPEGVLWGTSPHESFDVHFEAVRPDGRYAVQPFVPRFEPPPGATPAVAPVGSAASADPVLPSRSVVPDAKPVPEGSQAEAKTQGGPPTPKLPEFGSPTEAPPVELKPLGGHRDRFRWPG